MPGEERNDVIEEAYLSDYLSPEAVARIRSAPCTVLSLAKHCRKAIRKSLTKSSHRQGMSSSVRQLPLPVSVQSFLMMDEFSYDLDEVRAHGHDHYDDYEYYDDYDQYDHYYHYDDYQHYDDYDHYGDYEIYDDFYNYDSDDY